MTLGLPQTMGPPTPNPPPRAPLQFLTSNWPPALNSAFSPDQQPKPPSPGTRVLDPLSRPTFLLPRLLPPPASHPSTATHHPTIWDFASIRLLSFFFKKAISNGGYKKKRGGGKLFDNSCGFIVSNTLINEFKLKPVYALKLHSPSWAACPCSPLPSWGEGACIGGHLAVVSHLC